MIRFHIFMYIYIYVCVCVCVCVCECVFKFNSKKFSHYSKNMTRKIKVLIKHTSYTWHSQNIPAFRSYNLQDLLHEGNFWTWITFVGLQKESSQKMERMQLVCSSRKYYSILAGFGKEYLNKEQRGNTVASPIFTSPGSRPFLHVPRMKSALQGRLFCEATDIFKNAKEELKRPSQYNFQECLQQFHRRR